MSRFLEKQADYQPRLQELLRGVRGHAPREKSWKIELSETPYPAFPGSNANNLYVYFVELFSKSRYSWFPSRSAKIHDSQVFKIKNHDFYMFCKSWSLFVPSLERGWSLFAQSFLYTYFVRMKIWQINNLPFINMFHITSKVFSFHVSQYTGWKKVRRKTAATLGTDGIRTHDLLFTRQAL